MPNLLLGLFYGGSLANPDELPNESGVPAYYETTREAKKVARELMERHPSVRGFTVAKTFNAGHYRTVCTEWRDSQ